MDLAQALAAPRSYGKHLTPDQSMALSEDTYQTSFLTKSSYYTSPEVIFVEPSMTAASFFGNEKGPVCSVKKSEDLSSHTHTQKESYLPYMAWLIFNQGLQSRGMTPLCL
ncbi:hypothetical protein K3495_g9303 [Podosphaera aphanis]|nr:hypothetical protein K3495_g9303 [Podosphaera aphanis]